MSTRGLLPYLLVFLAATGPFLGTLGHDFLNWDDPEYVTDNPLLSSGGGLARIWTGFENPQVYPLVFTTFWIEHHLWGLRPEGYHAVNLLLHALASILLLSFLRRLEVPRAVALGAALLFALHPTQVASVAWISERKNVLSGVFYFACLGSYLTAIGSDTRSPLFRSWCFALLAVLSKTTAVSLPLTLLLMELWKRKGLPDRAGWLRMAPFLGLAAFMAGLTVFREHGPAISSDVALPDRVLLAGRAFWFYVAKLLVPVNLAGVYPRWDVPSSRLLGTIGWAGIAALVSIVIVFRRRLPLAVPVGLAQFCCAGLPTSGIIPFGYMDKSFVADHFLYLPSWGFWLAFFGFLSFLVTGLRMGQENSDRSPIPWRQPVFWTACGLSLAFLPVTVISTRAWKDTETFWNHVLTRAPDSWLAYGNRGQWYATQGQLEPALSDLRQALRLRPAYVEASFNLGYVLDRLGRVEEAKAAYEETLRLSPLHPDAHSNLGVICLRTGELARARREFEAAVALEPQNPAFLQNLRRCEAAERRAGTAGRP